MKHRLLILALLVLSLRSLAWAQNGNAVIIPFPGSPSGSCGPLILGLNMATGAVSSCLNGGWNAIGSGSGTVTNVSGTTNQVNVATGTTTPVVSLSSTMILPGSLTVTGATTGPSFTSNGSTAGFFDFPQGSTSAAVSPCNTANSACFQAPTSITAYVADVPAAAPTNNNSAWLFSNASPSVGSFAKMPQTALLTGSAYTNATTSFSSVTGLSFSVEASTNYVMSCQLTYQGSATTAGLKVQITGPASPTAVAINFTQTATTSGTVAATFTSESATAFSSALSDTLAITATTNMPATLTLGLVNGTNAGTIQVQAAAAGTGTVTIQPGSFCQLQ